MHGRLKHKCLLETRKQLKEREEGWEREREASPDEVVLAAALIELAGRAVVATRAA